MSEVKPRVLVFYECVRLWSVHVQGRNTNGWMDRVLVAIKPTRDSATAYAKVLRKALGGSGRKT